MHVKTRFPPSPTGYLHIGSLRTALYNYYFAKKHHGTFLLRIEDTDRVRMVPGAVEALIRTLSRMGITYDEGPMLENGNLIEKGENGPYIQSNRLNIYKTYVQKLLDKNVAYHCFCTKERLEELRQIQSANKQSSKYDRACLKLSQKDISSRLEKNQSHVVRMHIPEGKTTFTDEMRGKITIENSEIDDQVLLKTDGFPTYHLAVVIDDHLMGVTHVIRGEEWISSVPKHVLLYQWFGFPLPVFAHLPLILNTDKSKLSKRQCDVSIEDFLAKGYLEEALINDVSLLGFNPSADREIYTQEEFITAFDLKKMNKSGAVFDVNKLLWMNGQYIKTLSGAELAQRVKPFLVGGEGIDANLLERACEIEKTRISLLTEMNQIIPTYLVQPFYDASMLIWKKSNKEDAFKQLTDLRNWFLSLSKDLFESVPLLEEATKRYISERNLNNGNVLWPLRVALSGLERSAGPYELAWALRQEETIRRIDHAIKLLH
jgi:glutamyl-tRNA synthetase